MNIITIMIVLFAGHKSLSLSTFTWLPGHASKGDFAWIMCNN